MMQFPAFVQNPLDGISTPVFFLVLVWSLVWKGLALWKAARHEQKWWFGAILVINTIGILEILYLFVFSKKENKTEPVSPPTSGPMPQ
jgi:hypothetical protein